MKFLRFLKSIWVALLIGGLTYLVAAGIADWYLSALRSTGETVMAKDVLGVKIAPYAFAGLAFIGVIFYKNQK